ncbi:hypothetical protein STAS_23669 [Striga asiatica]|uniref:Haem-binding uptake Tiki superfamily ChaN domain-containing protein n=1 Tax=Striga asiatica TaxID=4170 RepID=A0A5A7QP10_STRAF|nr:hypothetical protein STAS_23669 [Striga asiatica]
MEPRIFAVNKPPPPLCAIPRGFQNRRISCGRRRVFTPAACHRSSTDSGGEAPRPRRRDVLITPLLSAAAHYALRSSAAAKADENLAPKLGEEAVDPPPPPAEEEEEISSRIYDATAIGEPLALGKENRKKVWEKMMGARVVYLGEAEQVPVRDDKELELDIVRNLRRRCAEADRSIALALEAFPCDLQVQLDQFMDKRIDFEALKSRVTHWPPQLWQEYEPLLTFCFDNGVRLIACGVPLEVLRTVQSEGVHALSKTNRSEFAPPAGSGFISGFHSISKRPSLVKNLSSQSAPYGSKSYLSVQARAVEDYTMSQIISRAVTDGGPTGMLVVVTGASHVAYGSRGTGLPARISRKMPKKNQVVVLLDPERQYIRREGEIPMADFLWYSAARTCSRNCFDRAEIARVMNAAGRRRDALPQDLQNGLDLGLVSPEVLQNLFDLERYPIISELTNHFQGFRERLLADPKFLNRLAIEESISITTTLLAQYERRKENFFEELDYVITDTVRATIVDFFTVWLPAPTLSFLNSYDDNINSSVNGMNALKGLLGSIPDNAFQKNLGGKDWNLSQRVASVIVGGLKLAGVGFISSIGAVGSSNLLYSIRKLLNPTIGSGQLNKRSPVLKTAVVYSSFLGFSANLRYQQWIDLARYTGVQSRKNEEVSFQTQDPSSAAALECNGVKDNDIDETNKTA